MHVPVECMLISMKLEEFKGFVFENNFRVAKLSVSTYRSRWTDSRSEIGSIRKRDSVWKQRSDN